MFLNLVSNKGVTSATVYVHYLYYIYHKVFNDRSPGKATHLPSPSEVTAQDNQDCTCQYPTITSRPDLQEGLDISTSGQLYKTVRETC